MDDIITYDDDDEVLEFEEIQDDQKYSELYMNWINPFERTKIICERVKEIDSGKTTYLSQTQYEKLLAEKVRFSSLDGIPAANIALTSREIAVREYDLNLIQMKLFKNGLELDVRDIEFRNS